MTHYIKDVKKCEEFHFTERVFYGLLLDFQVILI